MAAPLDRDCNVCSSGILAAPLWILTFFERISNECIEVSKKPNPLVSEKFIALVTACFGSDAVCAATGILDDHGEEKI